jgi:hypothetical protein
MTDNLESVVGEGNLQQNHGPPCLVVWSRCAFLLL